MSKTRATSLSNIPIPDPSAITTEQINRAKAELRTELDQRIYGLREILISRIDGMGQSALHLKEFFTERFLNIDTQFKERDVRFEQDRLSSTTALNSALQAQKEALQAHKEAAVAQNESNTASTTKSEAATAKQIDGLQALMKGSTDAINSVITDIKGRLDRGEGVIRGSVDTRTDRRSDLGSTMGIASLVVSIISVIVVILIAITSISHTPPNPTIVSSPAVVPLTPIK
jgi:hypothetical protein